MLDSMGVEEFCTRYMVAIKQALFQVMIGFNLLTFKTENLVSDIVLHYSTCTVKPELITPSE
jgi:hypothetical protein